MTDEHDASHAPSPTPFLPPAAPTAPPPPPPAAPVLPGSGRPNLAPPSSPGGGDLWTRQGAVPEPTPRSEPAFDAAAMVEATKIRAVDAPAYGDLPRGGDGSQARAEALRDQARRNRRRNRRMGFYIAGFIGIVMVAIGAVMVFLFLSEDDANDEPPPAPTLTIAP